MAHLTCIEHGKRIVIVYPYGNPRTVHRNGDGQRCPTPMLRSGNRLLDITGKFIKNL